MKTDDELEAECNAEIEAKRARMQAAVDEIREVCRKHGVVLRGEPDVDYGTSVDVEIDDAIDVGDPRANVVRYEGWFFVTSIGDPVKR